MRNPSKGPDTREHSPLAWPHVARCVMLSVLSAALSLQALAEPPKGEAAAAPSPIAAAGPLPPPTLAELQSPVPLKFERIGKNFILEAGGGEVRAGHVALAWPATPQPEAK